MNADHFRLESREQVVAFESYLSAYEKTQLGFGIDAISLVEAFDSFQKRKDGSRLFTALLDLRLSYSHLLNAIYSAGAVYNRYFGSGGLGLSGGSILDSEVKFFGKMAIHRFATEFVPRYRAIWDKTMGLIVLMYCSSEYDNYCQAKSRRKFFLKLAEKTPAITSDFGKSVSDMLTKFDNRFRTPEVHGTGSLRKWVFLMERLHENPQIELIGYSNILLPVFSQLRLRVANLEPEQN